MSLLWLQLCMSGQRWSPTQEERFWVPLVAEVGLSQALVSTSLEYFFFLLFTLQIVPSNVTDKKCAWERVDLCVVNDTEMVLDEGHVIGA
jgi:hypothetical protein